MCRSDIYSVSLPTRRNTEPEVFTFDLIPAVPAPHIMQCTRPRRRRPARVLYPSSSRRYLPRAERSPAKRWLLALCVVVLLQIYSEDDVSAEAVGDVSTADEGAFDVGYNVLPFASAEEQARRLTDRHEQQDEEKSSMRPSVWSSWWLNKTCPTRARLTKTSSSQSASLLEVRAIREQSAPNGGYVVALLYPVYHKLGSEQ
ncbi:radiation-inducible immediate-early gene IEX-1 [Hoplias malabaricus]|uniref:radiation-inducible immediate-early gene IEX-1 n=1 Tax=Hoplias malabaricus TaxID=27720 RepID=UPI0034622C31